MSNERLRTIHSKNFPSSTVTINGRPRIHLPWSEQQPKQPLESKLYSRPMNKSYECYCGHGPLEGYHVTLVQDL